MTHKQKADELVERFTKALTVNSWAVLKVDVIQCAIICVEEIIEATKFELDRPDTVSKTVYSTYWQSVLNELKSRL